MRNSRSNNRGPKKAGTTNRFAEGSRGPRSFDNDDRAGAGKKEFKGGAANFKRVKRRSAEDIASTSGEMRLNRFLSHAGICNRREADDLIAAGLVEVNGKVVSDDGVQSAAHPTKLSTTVHSLKVKKRSTSFSINLKDSSPLSQTRRPRKQWRNWLETRAENVCTLSEVWIAQVQAFYYSPTMLI